ncbi:hypothetical protein F5Y07DRAFT_14999 [Xylaria sp. FL0933]|nr:hypothetical protein F5Y07DRAFT_14999 [Xylaria sp. FL0933]
MAATMTMTLPTTTTPSTTTSTSLPINEPCCPNCGLSLPSLASDPHKALLQAQRQIEDLQSQVRLLNQKATAAVDRWADYEDELSRLRAASTSTNSTTTTSTKTNSNNNTHHNHTNNYSNRPHTPDPSVATSSPRSSFLGAGAASRISQLLSPRKSVAQLTSSTSSTHPPSSTTIQQQQQQQQRGSLSSVSTPALPIDRTSNSTAAAAAAAETRDLMTALARERRLREAAEEKLAATSREVEDLSASLFEQANDMVATERRARAALEERVQELGVRDEEKRARIGRLEGAVRRIERVRVVLEDRGDGEIEGEDNRAEGTEGIGEMEMEEDEGKGGRGETESISKQDDTVEETDEGERNRDGTSWLRLSNAQPQPQ